jgi:hypothetical protein
LIETAIPISSVIASLATIEKVDTGGGTVRDSAKRVIDRGMIADKKRKSIDLDHNFKTLTFNTFAWEPA